MDAAASIQKVTEEIFLRMGREVHCRTGEKNLVLAGGVALNCVANGRLLREGPFERIWIQPAAGDAGGALGAALFVWHQLLERPRTAIGDDVNDRQKGSFLGPRFSNEAIARFLAGEDTPYKRFEDETTLLETVAALLAEGKIVGWFQGRMEFGPRALGARCILGDPRDETMQARMNLQTKFREGFRPFAPAVLRQRAHEFFEMTPEQESPYMLLVSSVRERHRRPLGAGDEATMTSHPDLRRRVNVVRSTIPAVTHVDYTARVQTIDKARHGRFYRLIETFERRTSCPMLVNTSFNIRGEPIVASPGDAFRCFMATGMDALVMEDFLVFKYENNGARTSAARAKYAAQFQPD